MFGAIDVGGTKTLVGVFNSAGELVEDLRFETSKKYSDFLLDLAKIVEKLSTKQLVSVTAGIPGVVDRSRGVGLTFGNLPWQNAPFRDDLEKIFHCPIIVENDANLAGLYESKLLVKKYNKCLYITVSTGIGAGFCVNGHIEPNTQDIEVGSIMLEHEGKLMQWERFASGKAITEKYGKKASDITDQKAWDDIAKNIAVGVIDLIAVLTPDVVVFGGGVGSHFEKFKDILKNDLMEYKTNMISIPPLQKAVKSDDAVLYGCFALGKDKHEAANR
jgi:predicted NBD/HSP70 family sugar kinase